MEYAHGYSGNVKGAAKSLFCGSQTEYWYKSRFRKVVAHCCSHVSQKQVVFTCRSPLCNTEPSCTESLSAARSVFMFRVMFFQLLLRQQLSVVANRALVFQHTLHSKLHLAWFSLYAGIRPAYLCCRCYEEVITWMGRSGC